MSSTPGEPFNILRYFDGVLTHISAENDTSNAQRDIELQGEKSHSLSTIKPILPKYAKPYSTDATLSRRNLIVTLILIHAYSMAKTRCTFLQIQTDTVPDFVKSPASLQKERTS